MQPAIHFFCADAQQKTNGGKKGMVITVPCYWEGLSSFSLAESSKPQCDSYSLSALIPYFEHG